MFPSPAFFHEEQVTLLDGVGVRLRPIRPADAARLQSLHAHLSVDSIIHRFFGYVPKLTAPMAETFTHLDYVNQMAFVAVTGPEADERIVGVGRYVRISAASAEVAFTVEDQWQGRGIATALLAHLVYYARVQGFTTLEAYVMPDNVRMLEVFAHSGLPLTQTFDHEMITVRLDIAGQIAKNSRD